MRKQYTKALIKEIELRAKTISDSRFESRHGCEAANLAIDTVYFGGGTPSVLLISQMKEIMGAINSSFEIKPNAEITIEANPGTLGNEDSEILEKLSAYKEMGFNRLSMGVQSMDNDRLRFLGRIHTAEDVIRDVGLARRAGFDNINLDLIFSVPGETTEDAVCDAEKIIALGPEHISCYSMQIEEGTPFADQVEKGMLSETADEEDRETYHRICVLLKDSGYEHYEISNFAKSKDGAGFGRSSDEASKSPLRSKHNSLYWDMSGYIACGLGASGFTGGVRYKNLSDINDYMNSRCINAMLPTEEEHKNTPFDNISEAVFTGLRRREGITYEESCRAYIRNSRDDESGYGKEMPSDAESYFWEVFKDAKKEAAEFARQGFLITDDKGLRLTELGIDISNQIMALFV